MSVLDLESGAMFSSKTQAARALGVSAREVSRLLAIGWLVVVVRLPSL